MFGTKKNKKYILFIGTFLLFCGLQVQAAIKDADFDGLSDEGEITIYNTDPQQFDTDGDGLSDGVEVLNETDPLAYTEKSSDATYDEINVREALAEESPWAWYFGRASGFIAFILLWLSIFFGLSIRNPWLRKIIKPLVRLDIHIFFSIFAFLWVIAHSMVFMFDHFLHFSFWDTYIPFVSDSPYVYTNDLALGIFGLYAMIIITISALLRRYIPYKIFRSVHFLNVLVYILAFFHAVAIGSDMTPAVVTLFYVFSSILAFLWIQTLIVMLRTFRNQRLSKEKEMKVKEAKE